MAALINNNAASRLASSILAASTSLTVTAGEGAKFPAPTGGNWFPVTALKADGTFEIMRCTARSGDVLTVARAQEGTTALAFSAGDRVELRVTAAVMADKLNSEEADAAATPSKLVRRDANGAMYGDSLFLGDALYSSTHGYSIEKTFSANQSPIASRSFLYLSDAVLNADRFAYANYNLAENQGDYAEAFTHNVYAVYGLSRSGADSGGWSVTGKGTYYGGYFQAQYRSTDATFKNCANVIGVRALANVEAAAAVVANAYAFYGNISNTVAGGVINNAYGLYLAYTSTGTTTNKWSIYSASSDLIGYHAGAMRVGGSATQTPRATLDVVGDVCFDGIALGPDAVNVDTITGNGVITNVTSSTTGTFSTFQPKNGVIITYNDGTIRNQVHYASNGIWTRNKAGSAAYSVWTFFVQSDSNSLSAGSCTFNGNGAIVMLRNTASLSVGRDSAGVYSVSSFFGTMASNMPAVAMTNAGGRVNMTQGGNGTNLKLTVYGYNNVTPTDTTYLNVILGN